MSFTGHTISKEQKQRLIETYLGKYISIRSVVGEPQLSNKGGWCNHIDDIGQIHGTWSGVALNEDDMILPVDKPAYLRVELRNAKIQAEKDIYDKKISIPAYRVSVYSNAFHRAIEKTFIDFSSHPILDGKNHKVDNRGYLEHLKSVSYDREIDQAIEDIIDKGSSFETLFQNIANKFVKYEDKPSNKDKELIR